jgi:hypothetical protein
VLLHAKAALLVEEVDGVVVFEILAQFDGAVPVLVLEHAEQMVDLIRLSWTLSERRIPWFCNRQRSHQGHRLNGRTPASAFIGATAA